MPVTIRIDGLGTAQIAATLCSDVHWVLSIPYDSPRFLGRLGDYEPRCEARRLVSVKKVRPGADHLIGRDRSNRRGAWEVRQAKARGRFYATVRRARRFEGERIISCPPNRSVTIVIR